LIFVSKRFIGVSLLDQLNIDSFLFKCTQRKWNYVQRANLPKSWPFGN